MNIGLVIGKKNSVGVPGKNLREIVGRPAAEYAFIAAKNAGIEKIYVSTDSIEIAHIGLPYGARPINLYSPEFTLNPRKYVKALYNKPTEWGKCNSLRNLMLLSTPIPIEAVLHSPTPSIVRIADSLYGDEKKALAA